MGEFSHLTPEESDALFRVLYETNITRKYHRKLYPAIDPTRPELSQSGKTVLVTGGGTGVGFSIAQAFVRASAATIIILGRREQVLADAASNMEEIAKSLKTGTKIIYQVCDICSKAEVDRLWKCFSEQGISVDVFISNAVKFSEPKPLMELGAEEVWSQMEINAKAPLFLMEKFYGQPGDSKKVRRASPLLETRLLTRRPTQYVINVSSNIVHQTAHPGVAVRPAYTTTKMAAQMIFQSIAKHVSVEKMQITSFHPGLIWNTEWEKMGLTQDMFDEGGSLPCGIEKRGSSSRVLT